MKTLKYNGVVYKGYFISEDGDVFSGEKKLKPWDNGRGYLIVDVMKDNKPVRVRIHLASAETYLGKPKIKNAVVGHINNKKHDNSYKNLKYITQKENVASAQVEIKGKAYLSSEDQKKIKNLLKTKSVKEVADEMDLAYHIVRDIKIGKTYN